MLASEQTQRRMPALVLALGMVAALSVTVTPCRAAGLLVADNGFGGVLKIVDQSVNVTINNGVAVTTVEQVFLNTESRVVEALYTFPVPKKASVANFSMWINGKEMIGEVVEKQRAREIYESYKQTRRDPGLLEQVDFKRFEMRIFPIAAGAEQRVQIAYYQELDFDHDWATYVYPLATTSRQVTTDTSAESFSLTVDIKSEVPIAAVQSPSHGDQVALTAYDEHVHRASLESTSSDLERDVVIAYQVKRPFSGVDLVANRESTDAGHLLLTLTVGEELEQAEKGMDFVFVLDVSGSMRNGGKLGVSQQSILAFIEQLSAADRFEIITFNDAPRLFFNELADATDERIANVREFLSSLRARGGTSLRPAIETAYRYSDDDRALNVVLLSDGMTETNDGGQLIRLIQGRPVGSRVFAVGVGNDVNRPLLRDMAQKAGGLAAFLSHGDDLERQAEAFRRKLLRPAIEDVRLSFSDDRVHDIEPLTAANVYHGAPLRLYGRYRQGGAVQVKLTGTIMGAPFQDTAELILPDREDSNPEIERMWAWHRVSRLMGEARDQGETPVVVNEIVSLCEEFSIASQYASFIVLENDAEYQRWKIERRNATRIVRDRTAQERVNRQLETLRQRALAQLGPGQASDKSQPRADTMPANDGSFPPQSANQQTTVGTPDNVAGNRSRPDSRGFDLDFGVGGGGGGGGGGAIDPITGTLAVGLGSLGWAVRRRRNRKGVRKVAAA